MSQASMQPASPSMRAFRFVAGPTAYAVDIDADVVLLFVDWHGGWRRVPEFREFAASDESIAAAGGPVKFVDRIIEAVNAALRIRFGKPKPEDAPASPAETPQSRVLDEMRAGVVAFEMMDGVVQLRRR